MSRSAPAVVFAMAGAEAVHGWVPGAALGRQITARKVAYSANTVQRRNAADRGHGMKWPMWAVVAVAIAIGLALLAGQSDLRRFQRMRRM